MQETLYNIANEFIQVMEQIEELQADGETLDQDILKDTIESLQMPIQQKAENIMKLVQDWNIQAEARKAEAKRLTESAKVIENRAKQLKEYLDHHLEVAKIDRLETPLFTLSYRKGSEKIEIDESKLPAEYWVPQPPKPMPKPELKKLVKNGEEIDGVEIVRGKGSYTVK